MSGRIRHEHKHAIVPREIRAKVITMSYADALTFLGVGKHTLDALRAPGGSIRRDVLEKVRSRLVG
jgi:hypothetical protein